MKLTAIDLINNTGYFTVNLSRIITNGKMSILFKR